MERGGSKHHATALSDQSQQPKAPRAHHHCYGLGVACVENNKKIKAELSPAAHLAHPGETVPRAAGQVRLYRLPLVVLHGWPYQPHPGQFAADRVPGPPTIPAADFPANVPFGVRVRDAQRPHLVEALSVDGFALGSAPVPHNTCF